MLRVVLIKQMTTHQIILFSFFLSGQNTEMGCVCVITALMMCISVITDFPVGIFVPNEGSSMIVRQRLVITDDVRQYLPVMV